MLNLPGKVVVHPDRKTVLSSLGTALMFAAERALNERDVFHLALSGGSTPKPFYESLANDPRYASLPWSRTQIWIVDERRVADDSPQSNVRMIRSALTDRVAIASSHVHAIPVLSADPATEYESALRCIGDGDAASPVRIDFVLLGMGDDCHTASLFPHSDALRVMDRWVSINAGPNVVPPDRVTMTYPLLNAARQLAVLCVGQGKREALRRVAAAGESNEEDVPISGIRPASGDLTWFLDTVAAGPA